MSNVETVQTLYAAFGQGDIPAIMDHLADDVRWEDGAADHGIPWLTPGVGKDHVLGFFGIVGRWTFERFDIEGVSQVGDAVVGLLQVSATLPGEASVDGLEVHVWRFAPDGKVASFNHVVDTCQHLQAAQATAPATAG